MTKEQHPITLPSPELRAKWRSEAPRNRDAGISREDYLMDRAAEWSANQELKACCVAIENLKWFVHPSLRIAELRAARRPKPPSMKERALNALSHLIDGAAHSMDTTESAEYIRQALNQLPDD